MDPELQRNRDVSTARVLLLFPFASNADALTETQKPGSDFLASLPGFELPLLGSNQDSPDPESGVLPVTPRGKKCLAETTEAVFPT